MVRINMGPVRINWHRVSYLGSALVFFIVVITWFRSSHQYNSNSTTCDTSYLRHPDIAPVLLYCNDQPLTEIFSGSEGNAPPGYRLEAVAMVMRHGDRSALTDLTNYERPKRSCVMSKYMDTSLATRYVDTMNRNRNLRKPEQSFYNWDLFPDNTECENGQLTPAGALQLVKLGAYLRKVYVEDKALLNPNNTQSSVYFRTTNEKRTFQSGLAFLSAFIPELNLTSLHIDDAEDNTMCTLDTTVETDIACPCLAVSEFTHKVASFFELNGPAEDSQQLTVEALYAEVADILQVETASLPSLQRIADNALVQLCHGEPLPGRDGRCLSGGKLVDLHKLIQENGKRQLAAGKYELLSRLKMHPLLSDIGSKLNRALTQRNPVKMMIFAGHDSTLDPVTTVLGISDGMWPPYATRLVFEVYSQPPDAFTHSYIRVLLNGADVTEKVVFCKGQPPDACPFSAFINYVTTENLKPFNATDYSSACSQQIGLS